MGMALQKKFASLPDIDSAPDIYETPSLTEDASTIPESAAQSPSSSSSYHEFSEDDVSHVDRRRFSPNDARTNFRPARIDARNTDFSNRVTYSRRFYLTSSRRKRGQSRGKDDEKGDSENLEMRLRRIRWEVEEIKAEVENSTNDRAIAEASPDLANDINQLSNSVDSLYLDWHTGEPNPEAELEQAIEKFSATRLHALTDSVKDPKSQSSVQDAEKSSRISAANLTRKSVRQVADIDSRLSAIERAIGSSKLYPVSITDLRSKSILDSLDTFDRQISSMLGASTPSLDATIHKIRQLHQDADRLEAQRKASQAQEQEYGNMIANRDKTIDDRVMSSERTSKINALHGTLATIDFLSQDLPFILDRLRTLQSIHSVSGRAGSLVEEIDKRQVQQDVEISQWKESLRNVEEKLEKGESSLTNNTTVIGDWVRDLQARLDKLN